MIVPIGGLKKPGPATKTTSKIFWRSRLTYNASVCKISLQAECPNSFSYHRSLNFVFMESKSRKIIFISKTLISYSLVIDAAAVER